MSKQLALNLLHNIYQIIIKIRIFPGTDVEPTQEGAPSSAVVVDADNCEAQRVSAGWRQKRHLVRKNRAPKPLVRLNQDGYWLIQVYLEMTIETMFLCTAKVASLIYSCAICPHAFCVCGFYAILFSRLC